MNIPGPKKPPTPVQAHAQPQLRGAQQPLRFQAPGLAIYRQPVPGPDFEQQQQQASQPRPTIHHQIFTAIPRQATPLQQQHQHFQQQTQQLSQQQQQQVYQTQQIQRGPLPPSPHQQQQQQNYLQQQQQYQQQQQLQQQQHRQLQQQAQPQIRPLLPQPPTLQQALSQPVSGANSPYGGGIPHEMKQGANVAPNIQPTSQQQQSGPSGPSPQQQAGPQQQQPQQQQQQQQSALAPALTPPSQPAAVMQQNTVMYSVPSQPQQQRPPTNYIPRQNVPQMSGPPRQPRPQMTPTGQNMTGGPPGAGGAANSPSPAMYQTTMFMPGQSPHFMPGQPQVITMTGPPAPQMQYPGSMPQQAYMRPATGFSQSTQPGAGPPPQYTMGPAAHYTTYQTAQPAGPSPMMQPPQPSAPGKENMPRQPTNAVYYPQQPQQQPAAAGQQASPMQQLPGQQAMGPRQMVPAAAASPVATSQAYQKPKRKGLRIVDPSTGKDISEEIYSGGKGGTPPQSGQSSNSRGTPVTGGTPPPASSSPQQPAAAAAQAAPTAAAEGQEATPSPPTGGAAAASATEQNNSYPSAEIQAQFAVQVAAAIRGSGQQSDKSSSPAPSLSSQEAGSKQATPASSLPPSKESTPAPVNEVQQQADSKTSSAKTSEEREVEQVIPPQKEPSPAPQPAAVIKEPSPPAPAPLPQREDDGQGRKRKGKPKAKELNQKDKEGTDMDAFMDVSPSSSSPAPADEAEAPSSEAGAAAAAAAAATPAAATTPKEASPAAPAPTAEPPAPAPAPTPQVMVQPPTPEVGAKEPTPPPEVQLPEQPAADNKEASPPVTQPEPKAVSPIQEESQELQETIRDKNEKNAAPPVVENNVTEKAEDSNQVQDSKREQLDEVVNSVESNEEQQDSSDKKNEDDDDVDDVDDVDDYDETKSQTEPVIGQKKFELKYTYREDQWSPLNPEGKMLYDRHFLLDLQFSDESTSKPTGLPNLPDIILDTPIKKSESQPANIEQMGINRMLDFTPGYIKSMGKPPPSGKRGSQQRHGPPGGPGGPGGGGGGRGSQQREGVKVISIERPVDVKLHTAKNAWKPADTKKDEGDDPNMSKNDALFKKVTGILNKLTPQKFQTLIQQVLSFDIDTEERLKGSIDLIFEKALDEPNFSVAYANMCKCMTVLKVPSANNPGEMVLFRNLLLNRCQKEFEKDKTDITDLARMREELEACKDEDEKKKKAEVLRLTEWRAKRRSLGNIRFIGELFKLKMLTEKIMHDCLVRLLKSEDEESYECLCRLLTTIGKDIDNPKAKQRVDTYFQQLDKIVKNKKKSARVRFMLQDVIELRRSKWVPRRDDNAPKTIEQIHKEAQVEEVQRQQLVARLQHENKPIPQPQGGRGGRHGGRGSQHGQTAPVGESDGWTTMSGKSNRIDPGKMKLSRPQMDDASIQLGPGGRPGSFGTWGRGSSGGGGKASSQEGDRQPASSGGPANRFSALSQDGYDRSRGAAGRGMAQTRGDSREKGRSGMGNQTPRRGGPGARSSMDHDREAALSAARNIGHPGGPRGGSGSRNQSRENSRGRDDSRDSARRGPPAAAAAAPAGRELSEKDMERKTKSLLDEYLHLHDFKEAIACVRELESPLSLHMFVYYSLNHVLEKTNKARQMTGQLMHDLVKNGAVSVDQYLKGLLEVLEFAEDMVIDIPKIWQYLGEMIGPMVQDGSVPLNFLKTACQPLVANSCAGKLVAAVLNDASQRLGHLKVGDQWRASGLTWEDFLAPSQDLNKFIQEHKLEFTLEGEEPRSPVGKGLSDERIQAELDALIVNKAVDNSNVFDWVEANVGEDNTKQPAFIRALMTAVCSSAITGTSSSAAVDTGMLTKRVDLLQRYLDHNDTLELQALYALQALVHRLEHPPGVLRTFFDTLYDEDIISEDAFNQWDSSTEAAEMAGKGVARSSVEQFFTWLREAEEETPAEN